MISSNINAIRFLQCVSVASEKRRNMEMMYKHYSDLSKVYLKKMGKPR